MRPGIGCVFPGVKAEECGSAWMPGLRVWAVVHSDSVDHGDIEKPGFLRHLTQDRLFEVFARVHATGRYLGSRLGHADVVEHQKFRDCAAPDYVCGYPDSRLLHRNIVPEWTLNGTGSVSGRGRAQTQFSIQYFQMTGA